MEQKHLNIFLISVLFALISTACARLGMLTPMTSTPRAVITDPTGNPQEPTPGDININSGQTDAGTEIPNPDEKPTTPDVTEIEVDTTDVPAIPNQPTVDHPVMDKIEKSDFTPLTWEKSARAKEWTKMIYTIIETEHPELLNKKSANDVEFFCPAYYALPRAQRLNFWGQFFVSLAWPESNWEPMSQMVETTMDIDPVTKKQVKSEGLLQLSYQDESNYHLDCGFEWNNDKLLSSKDPRRTILDPYLNLRCGIKIFSIQLKKYKAITMKTNVYWSVLRIGGKYSQINEIAKTTKNMKICQKK